MLILGLDIQSVHSILTSTLGQCYKVEAIIPRDHRQEEGDAGEKEGVVDANEGEESELELIRKCGPDGLELKLFFELDPVTMEPKACKSNYEASDNALDSDPRFRAYEPPHHIMNIDLSAGDCLDFSQLSHRIPSHASTVRDI
ncbi:hypothetical protein PVK06_043054 [Gossypium arboreum]|uniref:Uncharacterized protein n=1 Tax=Gossypium arboreum TaxID=29729 RepID=A0ABR0MMV9_GOSAR|nr:hypothetical protein PVK06_043054 [Gossypium arboreum]